MADMNQSSVKVIGHFNKSKRLSPQWKIAFYDADDTLSPSTPNTIKRIQHAWNKLMCSLKKYTLIIVISNVPTPDQIA